MVILVLVVLSLLIIVQLPKAGGGRKAVLLAIAFTHLLTIMEDPVLSVVGTSLRIPVWMIGILYLLTLKAPHEPVTPASTSYRLYQAFLVVFLLWGAASLLWSVNRIDTVVKVLNFSLIVLFLHLNFTRHWKGQSKVAMNDLRVISNAVFFVLLLSTVLTLPDLMETLNSTSRYQGLFQNPNTLAALAAVCFFPTVQFYYRERKGIMRLAPILLLGALFLSGSRSSTVAIVAAGAITLMIYTLRNIEFVRHVIPALSLGGFSLLVIYLGREALSAPGPRETPLSLPRQFDLDVSATLFNAREVLWQAGFQIIEENPAVGVGFNGTRTVLDRLYDMGVYKGEARQLHNSYLEILVDLGFVGGFLFLLVALILAGRFIRGITTAPLLSAAFMVPVVLSLTESAIFGLSSIVAIMFWTTALMLFTTDQGQEHPEERVKFSSPKQEKSMLTNSRER